MKFYKIVLVSILLLIFAIGAVSAADENTTDAATEILSAEPTEEVGAAQTGTFSELKNLVDNTSSGKTLYLEKDYVNDGSFSSAINISNAITIDGQGHTINAKKYGSNIFITTQNVILKNIKFINSVDSAFRGNYYNKSSIINCYFRDCNTNSIGGGAIYYGNAYNCTFKRCIVVTEASGHGGAIFYGDAYNCTFTDCSAWQGGAIYQGDAYNCTFTDCSASDGGALMSVDAYDCSFINCHASYGGALYVSNAYNCSFINCSAKVLGGAMYCIHETMNDAYNCSFINCSAQHGGALYLCRATGCSFINCSSPLYSGGAISAGRAINSSFVNCSAKREGAAIYGGYYQRVSINCSFVNCSSENGSIIYNGDAYDSYFERCSSNEGCIISNGNAYDSKFVYCTYKNIIDKGKYANCSIIPYNLYCPNLTVKYGEYATLPVKVLDGDKNIDGITVNVKIYKNNQLINSFSTTSGSNLNIDAAPGNYIISLDCINVTPLNASLVVNKGSPKLTLANNFAKSGEIAKVKVTMSKKANGFVKITINNKTYRVQISSGVVSVNVPNLADGSYSVGVTYAGNTYHTAETITDTFHVGKFTQGMELSCKNIKVGETERLIANLAKDATGFVRFIIGDDTYKVAIENGAANVDINNLKAGTYSVTLKYGGNYKYNAETVSKTFTVVKSSPGITITANNINVGDTAIIRVNVANDVPGNVWITVNGESHKVKIENSVATLTLSGLKAGTYDISVKYNGNYKYNAETKTASFTVAKSSPGLSMTVATQSGKTTVTANIAADAPGNVKVIVDGGTPYSAKITNGVASYTISGLSSGTHTIKVTYAGNYKYTAQSRTKTITI